MVAPTGGLAGGAPLRRSDAASAGRDGTRPIPPCPTGEARGGSRRWAVPRIPSTRPRPRPAGATGRRCVFTCQAAGRADHAAVPTIGHADQRPGVRSPIELVERWSRCPCAPGQRAAVARARYPRGAGGGGAGRGASGGIWWPIGRHICTHYGITIPAFAPAAHAAGSPPRRPSSWRGRPEGARRLRPVARSAWPVTGAKRPRRAGQRPPATPDAPAAKRQRRLGRLPPKHRRPA